MNCLHCHLAGDLVNQTVGIKNDEIYFEINKHHQDKGRKFRISIKELK